MDLPDLDGALDGCMARLRPGGSLMCTLTHPCFETGDRDDDATDTVTVRTCVTHYPFAQRWGERIHRPLSDYVNGLQRGMQLQALAFADAAATWDVPEAAILICSMRDRTPPSLPPSTSRSSLA